MVSRLTDNRSALVLACLMDPLSSADSRPSPGTETHRRPRPNPQLVPFPVPAPTPFWLGRMSLARYGDACHSSSHRLIGGTKTQHQETKYGWGGKGLVG